MAEPEATTPLPLHYYPCTPTPMAKQTPRYFPNLIHCKLPTTTMAHHPPPLQSDSTKSPKCQTPAQSEVSKYPGQKFYLIYIFFAFSHINFHLIIQISAHYYTHTSIPSPPFSFNNTHIPSISRPPPVLLCEGTHGNSLGAFPTF
jgi:hypothetical protein